jgi:hypothetical protein
VKREAITLREYECRLRALCQKVETSGKSPALCHHRKNPKARAGNLARAFPWAQMSFCDLGAAVFSESFGPQLFGRDLAMRIFLVATLIAGSLVSFEAKAQERAGDAALGAVSGAIVLGPIGAVAGAFVGYTAGPSIARSWGMHRSPSRPRAQRTSQMNAAPEQTTGSIPASPPPVIRYSPPPTSLPPASPPAVSTPMASTKMPPVQSLE